MFEARLDDLYQPWPREGIDHSLSIPSLSVVVCVTVSISQCLLKPHRWKFRLKYGRPTVTLLSTSNNPFITNHYQGISTGSRASLFF